MARYFENIDDEIVFTFGKHRGELLHEIADDDVDYLIWILREVAEGKGFDEELAVEVEDELRSREINFNELI